MFELMVSNIGQRPRMSAEEVQQTSINFALAGYLSTKFLIANGTFTLINNPQQLTLLRKDPELMPGAIEEMLRYDAPAQLVDRYASRDVELGGVKLKKNDKVTAVLGSANRDTEAFTDPDVFDITRKGTHVAFGSGIHESSARRSPGQRPQSRSAFCSTRSPTWRSTGCRGRLTPTCAAL